MYHIYIKEKNVIDAKKLLISYKDLDEAYDRVEAELEKNPDFKYSLEETTGRVDNYGELIIDVIEEN